MYEENIYQTGSFKTQVKDAETSENDMMDKMDDEKPDSLPLSDRHALIVRFVDQFKYCRKLRTVDIEIEDISPEPEKFTLLGILRSCPDIQSFRLVFHNSPEHHNSTNPDTALPFPNECCQFSKLFCYNNAL
jgi:hypothetical protein